MTTRNEAIGQVECPAKGCTLVIPVFRFKARPTERMQRFANKLYCRCPKHGQFGGAAGDDEMQNYITEHSTKCQSESTGSETPATPAIQPKVPAPTKAPRAAKQPASQPAAKPAPEPEQPEKKSSWFGL